MKAHVTVLNGLGAIALALAPIGLPAATIEYSTTGIFTSSGTNVLSVGGGQLVFNDLGLTTVTSPSNVSFGFFDSSGIDGGGTIPSGTQFTLTINEVLPVVGTDTVAATLSGFINATQSSVTVDFASPVFTIDGAEYTIAQPPGGIDIVPPSSNGGITTIQGSVTNAVPEPATFLSLASGLAILALGTRLRRASS